MSTILGTSKMIYRYLGNSGLKVSALSFGNWITQHEADSQSKSDAIIRKCYEGGVNFFDTAEGYGLGIAESVMGSSLKKLNVEREDLVVSTKLFFGREGINRSGLSRKHIIEGLNNSLRRLQLEYVDVVFCHRPDYEVPLEETCVAMDSLIRQGKAFYWGTSEWPAQRIMEAYMICEKLGLVKPVVEQPQYNMFNRAKFEVEYGVLFDKYRMGSTVWSPLAGGVLTGKYMNKVEGDTRYAQSTGRARDRMDVMIGPDVKERTDDILRRLTEIARELDGSLAQLALAWVLYSKDVSTAIFGASRESQVENNLKAIEVFKKLTPEIMERIETILDNRPETDIDFRLWQPFPYRR